MCEYPRSWRKLVDKYMEEGKEEEAQMLISRVISVCEEDREAANSIAIEYDLVGI